MHAPAPTKLTANSSSTRPNLKYGVSTAGTHTLPVQFQQKRPSQNRAAQTSGNAMPQQDRNCGITEYKAIKKY